MTTEPVNAVTVVDLPTLALDTIPVGPLPHHCKPWPDGRTAAPEVRRHHHRFARIRHSVEVTAESLFDAGGMALGTLLKAGWVEDSPGLGTRLKIEVREPSVTHYVTVAQLHRWASGATRSPAND